MRGRPKGRPFLGCRRAGASWPQPAARSCIHNRFGGGTRRLSDPADRPSIEFPIETSSCVSLRRCHMLERVLFTRTPGAPVKTRGAGVPVPSLAVARPDSGPRVCLQAFGALAVVERFRARCALRPRHLLTPAASEDGLSPPRRPLAKRASDTRLLAEEARGA